MSSLSGMASTATAPEQKPVSFNNISTPTRPNRTEAPAGADSASQDQSHDAAGKSYAAQLGLQFQVKDYSWDSLCPFSAGQYTEF
jgi:hypothetical protein